MGGLNNGGDFGRKMIGLSIDGQNGFPPGTTYAKMTAPPPAPPPAPAPVDWKQEASNAGWTQDWKTAAAGAGWAETKPQQPATPMASSTPVSTMSATMLQKPQAIQPSPIQQVQTPQKVGGIAPNAVQSPSAAMSGQNAAAAQYANQQIGSKNQVQQPTEDLKFGGY